MEHADEPGTAEAVSRKRPLASTTTLIDDALDRVVLGDATDFIPASKWEGSKAGFYFARGTQGVGYYRDTAQQQNRDDGAASKPPVKKARGVHISEDHNETRIIYAPPTRDDLLRDAEAQQSQTKIVDLTRKGVKVAVSSLQKAIQVNQLARAKHPDDPTQYMDSEVALYESIAVFKSFAVEPTKLYGALLDADVVSTLLQLLLHDNTDIATAVVAVFVEWLDYSDDVSDNGLPPAVVRMASTVLQDGAELLVGTLTRFQRNAEEEETPESGEDDNDEVGRGPEDVLTLLENLMNIELLLQQADEKESSDKLVSTGLSVAAMLCRETFLLTWLFRQVKEESIWKDRSLELLALVSPKNDVYMTTPDWSQLKPFSASILPDSSAENESKQSNEVPEEIDGIEVLLQALANYRKKQPNDDQEVDALENICLVLASAVTFSDRNVQAFVERQGIELVLRCLKEAVHAGGAALNLLYFSGSAAVHKQACEHLIEAGGLKTLFPMFMGRHLPQPATVAASTKKSQKEWHRKVEETTIRILYTLTRHIDDNSPNDAKQRMLAKFVDPSRCVRLVDRILHYDKKARLAEYKFYRSGVEDSVNDESTVEYGALDAKLVGGGDVWHRLSAIAAFVCTGSQRCHRLILDELRNKEAGIGVIREALQEFVSVLEESHQSRQLQVYLDHL